MIYLDNSATTRPCEAAIEAVTQTLKGWKCDISSAGSFSELPKEARDYVLFLERKIGIPIRYITVGPSPDAVITR